MALKLSYHRANFNADENNVVIPGPVRWFELSCPYRQRWQELAAKEQERDLNPHHVAQHIDLLGLYASAAARSGVNGIFCLSCAEPQKEKIKGKSAPKFYVQHFRPKDIAALAAEAINRSAYANVYFDQNLRRVGIPSESRGKFEDIAACLALVIEEDADQKKFLEMPSGVKPTAIVRTSAIPAENTHLHFVFDRALSTQEGADLQELAYRKMGGDASNKDITHCWRVPGTKNHPDWRKIERGRPSIPQAVDVIGGTGLPVDPDDLRKALEAMPDRHPPKPTGSRHLKGRGSKGNGHAGGNGASSERDLLLARCGPDLITDINEEGKPDRSAHFGSVAWRLFYANFTPDEVLVLVSGTPCAIKYDASDRLEAEVERCFVKWQAEQEEGGGGGGGGGNGTGGGIGGGKRTEKKDQKIVTPPPGPDSDVKVLQAVKEVNKDHAFIMSRGGKACVLHEGFDEKGEPQEFYYGINDFHNILLNRGGLIVGAEKPKFVEKSKIWMRHRQRRQYQSVVFDPSTTARDVRGHYNLWSGFGVEPVQGSWTLLREHVRAILAAGDEDADRYIYNWLAWGVQNPEKQAEAALASIGPIGSGKGVVYRTWSNLFGRRHGLHISNSSLLTGRFSAHLEKCAALFADEAFHVGDKQAESQLKRIITEPTLIIEGKGKDAFQAPNRLKIAMASNEGWIAPVGPKERRFAVFKVCEDRVGDKQYFTRLYNEIKAGGASAMLYDLLNANIEGFHPRWSIPQNEALKDQARQSLSPEMKWLLMLLQEGELPYSTLVKPEQGSFPTLIEHAREAIDRKRPLQDLELAELLKEWGVEPKHTKLGNFWVFPPLKGMRERFDREYGKQNWPASEGWVKAPARIKPVKRR